MHPLRMQCFFNDSPQQSDLRSYPDNINLKKNFVMTPKGVPGGKKTLLWFIELIINASVLYIPSGWSGHLPGFACFP